MIRLALGLGRFGRISAARVTCWLLGKWQAAGWILAVQAAVLAVQEHIRSALQHFFKELRAVSVQAVSTKLFSKAP